MEDKVYRVPTGHIVVTDGNHGRLEYLSIGDYGKDKNIKADFMGLNQPINGVEHCDLLPLEEKWVVTVSSQYGCSMACSFCDVPKVGSGINATYKDILKQVLGAISLHPEVKKTKRLNLHYARMGEPTWNIDVINSAYYLSGYFSENNFGFHPVVSTMMPKNNNNLYGFISEWVNLKNNLNGEAGLQLSINTTDSLIRKKTMPKSMSIPEISDMMYDVLSYIENLKGRKITLNFALTDAEVDANYLLKHFSPKYFICKITPMHKTSACKRNGLLTDGGYDHYYPYENVEKSLKKVGFDVIVFIPSKEEDESRITCGNAILSDKPND